jgi:hypothetical protein
LSTEKPDLNGSGGTITFLYNGAPHGPAQSINFKLQITPGCLLECNASLNNTANSAIQKVRQISISVAETSDSIPPSPGDVTVYGDPGTRFPLGLDMAGPSGNYNLTVPSGLSLVKRVVAPTPVTTGSTYSMNALATAYSPSQSNGGVTPNTLTVVGAGATYSSSRLNLPAGTYLSAGAIGISLPTSSDPATTRTPRSITIGFKGILPQDGAPLVSLYEYDRARFSLHGYWQPGQVSVLSAVSAHGTDLRL